MKLILYSVTVVCIALMTMLYHQSQEVDNIHIISVSTYYYVIEQVKQDISVTLYMSDANTSLINEDHIDRLELYNQTIRMDVTLDAIVISHSETFESKTYYAYTWILKLPKLGNSVGLEHAKLDITYVDDTSVSLYLGFVEYFVTNPNHVFPWTDMYATRRSNIFTIDQISIEIDAPIILRSSNYLSETVTQTMTGYTLSLMDTQYIKYDVPVFITSNDYIELISGMTWIDTMRMLSQTRGYHYEYTYYLPS